MCSQWKKICITSIRSNHEREFENDNFQLFYGEIGILHNFLTPRTPQQNVVAERKNKYLKEMARTMLNDNWTLKHCWVERVNTECYLQNKIYIRPILKKTPYELWKGWKLNISYFHPFGCKHFILNTKDNLGKFDSKSDNGTFLGYFETSKTFRVYNSRTLEFEEVIRVRFEKSESNKDLSELDESFSNLRLDDGIKEKGSSNQGWEAKTSNQHEPPEEAKEPTGCIMRRNHPES